MLGHQHCQRLICQLRMPQKNKSKSYLTPLINHVSLATKCCCVVRLLPHRRQPSAVHLADGSKKLSNWQDLQTLHCLWQATVAATTTTITTTTRGGTQRIPYTSLSTLKCEIALPSTTLLLSSIMNKMGSIKLQIY